MQKAERVKLHKMQKVAELAQWGHMDKVHTQVQLGQMVSTVKKQNQESEQNSWIATFAAELPSF